MVLFYRHSPSIIWCLLLLLALFTPPLKANDSEEIRQLYQVEVIVFAPRNPPKTTESWEQTRSVQWPSPLVFLKQSINETEELPEDPDSTTADLLNQDQNKIKTFYALDPEQFILFDTESYLNRQGYKVLSHQSWLQYISNQEAAPHIVIYGGDFYGEHQTIEGSIQVYVERYLHINTDLWLIDFSPNVGQSLQDIPTLPPRPFNPGDFLRHSAEGENTITDTPSWLLSEREQERYNLLNIHDINTDTAHDQATSFQLEQPATTMFDSYLLESQWLPNQIIPLRQHRKMKSGELHYIDHPLFGILVQVNRYEQPEPSNDDLEVEQETQAPATTPQ